MREQIRNLFNNTAGQVGSVKEEFANDVSGVLHSIDKDGTLGDAVRNELLKITVETIRGIDEIKKAYLHRKSLLNKLISEVSANAADDQKTAMKQHVMNMMNDIDQRLAKFAEDEKKLQTEIELIKKKQI